jgi:pimeloyl-ACP methyl ester carboxylesterase
VQPPSFPGVVEPERTAIVDSIGVRLRVCEWGDPQAPPLVLLHGMFDHARSFALLAPVLAERFRVVAVDARGHGDSEWADAYSWAADIVDAASVLRWLGEPAVLVGHSKGGGQASDTARAVPELVRRLVIIDGLGPPPLPEDEQPVAVRLAEFLDRRQKAGARRAWRPYASLEDLVERRRAQNPRLSREWLRYFLYHGAREAEDGWRWKADPYVASGFGPWRPEWISPGFAALRLPVQVIVGSEQDTWGPLPEEILGERLRQIRGAVRITVPGAGHFVHIERPRETAAAILDFAGAA